MIGGGTLGERNKVSIQSIAQQPLWMQLRWPCNSGETVQFQETFIGDVASG